MSFLAAGVDNQGIIMFVDTLMTELDGTPISFTDKCHAIPHANILIAATGLAEVLHRWSHAVRAGFVGTTLDEISSSAATTLNGIFADTTAGLDRPPTTTIYHAGKGDDGQWRIDRFSLGRDTDEVTRLTVGQGFAKPSGWTPDGQRVDHPDDLNFADDYIAALSERLRNEQHHAAPEHRIYIGGDIIRYILTDTGITARRIHRFADADDQLAAIRQAVNSADVT